MRYHPSEARLTRAIGFVAAAAALLSAGNVRSSADGEHRDDNATVTLQGRSARCANDYTVTCAKRDVLAVLDALDGDRSYEIFPGFTIFQRRSSAAAARSEEPAADADDSARLDRLIDRRLNDYAENVDLRVRLFNPIDTTTSRSVGAGVLDRILPFLRMSRKKKDHRGLYWAVGTMTAVGATALMALSGKALMTAGAALAMAIYSCMKGGGGGGGGGGKGGGSVLTATLLEESTLQMPHRQCAEAVVDITGSYPADADRYHPGSRKTVDIVPYRAHQTTSDDYVSSSQSRDPVHASLGL